MRINKYLAEKNFATRTGADELIKKGLVFVNDRKAIIGEQISETDKVEVRYRANKKDSKNNLNKNTPPEYVYYAYNKKAGISTNPENTKMKGIAPVRHILQVTNFPIPHPNPLLGKAKGQNVFPIGRLDVDSYGLIIMTNDGRVTDRLLSPKYIHEKEYIVKIEGTVTDRFIENMSQGVTFDKYKSLPCKVTRVNVKTRTGSKYKETTDNYHTFKIILTEGKKRQIRRMCEALYQKVIDLKRIRIMNIELGNLKPGEYKEITGKDLQTFLKSLKLL